MSKIWVCIAVLCCQCGRLEDGKIEKTFTYYINYNSNGGAGSMDKSVHQWGVSSTLHVNRYTRAGYEFAGWGESTSGPVKYRNQQSVSGIHVAEQVTLYAQWVFFYEGMVWINGGTFTMGSPASEVGRSYDEVQHQVTIGSFYMGKYELTQKEYQEVMGTNPSLPKRDNLPVDSVSWHDAIEYCNARSRKEGLTPAYTISGSEDNRWVDWNRSANGYRLPTEAEWEYACRAGTTTPFSTGNNITASQAYYNYPYNNNARGTTEVGSFAPNPWGLYDMHGNLWEWCWDWYGDYSTGDQTDPLGDSSGPNRVVRGGCWVSSGQSLRSANRGYDTPSSGAYSGFRVVRP